MEAKNPIALRVLKYIFLFIISLIVMGVCFGLGYSSAELNRYEKQERDRQININY